jgi:hypothetical protein
MKEIEYPLDDENEKAEKEGFGELIKFTIAGFAGGLVLGTILDSYGFQRSAAGQWLVRTFSGEGESIFEGIYSIRQRFRRAEGTMSEAYGWGKFLFIPVPWFIDLASRLLGMNVYGVETFYIPYFYALSDQIGANVSGLIFLRKKERSWLKAVKQYIRHPVMLASLLVILIVPIGLLTARLQGFSPTTQTYTAMETIAANLCWVPPLVGWLREMRDLREE